MPDFVNFKLAQKLKDKGFREECLYHYPCSGGDYAYANCCPGDDVNTDYLYQCNNKDSDRLIDAPTISQVLKWLREEKKLHIEFVGNACGYLYIVSDIPCEGGTDRYCSDYSGPNDGGTWNNYEDCALNAIQYVLDNFI